MDFTLICNAFGFYLNSMIVGFLAVFTAISATFLIFYMSEKTVHAYQKLLIRLNELKVTID